MMYVVYIRMHEYVPLAAFRDEEDARQYVDHELSGHEDYYIKYQEVLIEKEHTPDVSKLQGQEQLHNP